MRRSRIRKNNSHRDWRCPDSECPQRIEAEIAADNAGYIFTPPPRDRKLKIVLYIGSLGPGGAERQLCNHALRLHESGHEVRVLTANRMEGDHGHYLSYLREAGVPAEWAEPAEREAILENHRGNPSLLSVALGAVPGYMSNYTLALINALLPFKPDVLHCWLDYCNVVGGLAGLVSGVPRIVMGGRNVNPSHFVWMNLPWFKEWYDVLIRSRRVVLANNSHTGAADYAEWLKIPPERIRVVHNAVNPRHLDSINPGEAGEFRQSLGLADSTRLVGGVFRLSSEKRPLDFIRVIAKVREEIPDVRAVIAGIGTMTNEVQRHITAAGLGQVVALLGRRTDVFTIIQACNVILQTSEKEGTPNALMEAQYLGVPVVATRVGGTPEVIREGVTGELHSPGDIPAMTESVLRILHDRLYARKLGENGRRLMAETFSVEKTTGCYLDLYLEPSAAPLEPLRREERTVRRPAKSAGKTVHFLLVSAYLSLVGLWLVLTKRVDPGVSFVRLVRDAIRRKLRRLVKRRGRGKVTNPEPEKGFCYTALVPAWMVSDANGHSELKLFENGVPLGLAHSLHDDIRQIGLGRYSHWNHWVYFSTSDNSDPRTNGRTYTFSE